MTDQEKIIELAKLDGWIWHKTNIDGGDSNCVWKRGDGCWFFDPPNYLKYYDAIIPLVRKLTENERTAWGYALYSILRVSGVDTKKSSYTWITCIQSTPRQMADAYLVCKGVKID